MTRLLGITTFFLFICFATANAQKEPKSVKKRQEQLDRQEAEKKRQGEKAHEEGVEKHMKIQTKETRKRMKKNRRKAKRHNDNRSEFFLKRWLSYAYSEENIFFADSSVCCKFPV